jgi:hypothetical protein
MTKARFAIAGAVVLLIAALIGTGSLVQARSQQSNQSGAAAIGGLIDVVVNNTQVLNNSPVLSGDTFKVVNLNDALNGNETNVLSGILTSSQVLSQNVVTVQDILNNSLDGNTVLQNFLNSNNITVDRVIAIDALSGSTGPVTLYVFQPR